MAAAPLIQPGQPLACRQDDAGQGAGQGVRRLLHPAQELNHPQVSAAAHGRGACLTGPRGCRALSPAGRHLPPAAISSCRPPSSSCLAGLLPHLLVSCHPAPPCPAASGTATATSWWQRCGAWHRSCSPPSCSLVGGGCMGCGELFVAARFCHKCKLSSAHLLIGGHVVCPPVEGTWCAGPGNLAPLLTPSHRAAAVRWHAAPHLTCHCPLSCCAQIRWALLLTTTAGTG